MQIKPVRTNADYERTLREIEGLWGAGMGAPEEDGLDVLATPGDAYNRSIFPSTRPTQSRRFASVLSSRGLDPCALVGVIGDRSSVYEVMQRKRALSEMTRRLHQRFGVPGRSADSPDPPLRRVTHQPVP